MREGYDIPVRIEPETKGLRDKDCSVKTDLASKVSPRNQGEAQTLYDDDNASRSEKEMDTAYTLENIQETTKSYRYKKQRQNEYISDDISQESDKTLSDDYESDTNNKVLLPKYRPLSEEKIKKLSSQIWKYFQPLEIIDKPEKTAGRCLQQ
ncbi:9196_t:CDS:2, partial [Acaulospora morrowiae]